MSVAGTAVFSKHKHTRYVLGPCAAATTQHCCIDPKAFASPTKPLPFLRCPSCPQDIWRKMSIIYNLLAFPSGMESTLTNPINLCCTGSRVQCHLWGPVIQAKSSHHLLWLGEKCTIWSMTQRICHVCTFTLCGMSAGAVTAEGSRMKCSYLSPMTHRPVSPAVWHCLPLKRYTL